MHHARGQGTVEYIAVLLLVMLVLGGGTAAAATGAGAEIATAVPHQVMRALCIVTGGDCDRDRAPCVTGSATDSRSWSATVAVVRIGHGRVLVRERRSDGSEIVTLTTAPSLGAETIEGTGARISRGRRRLALGGAVTASVIAALGHGKSWVLPDHASADALVAALERDEDVRAPDEELRQVEAVAGISASRTVGRNAGATATGSATARGAIGRSTDRRTGSRTYFIETGADAVFDLSARLRVLRAAASGELGGSARLALTVDGDGRWVELALLGTGEVAGSVSLPSSAGAIAEALNVPTSGGRRWVAEAHLDLRDAGNLAAAKLLVAQASAVPPRPLELGRAALDLARRIDERAVIDVRAYALDRTSDGFEAHAGDVVGVGVGREHSTERTRLISATTRGLDGQWRPRTDCLHGGT